MALYNRGTEGLLNDILTVLGTTKASLWPFWEATGSLITCIGAGDLTSAETGGAAEALEDDFAPLQLPCGLYSYHFHPTGDHHLAGVDHANYSFAGDAACSFGAWIRPNTIVNNTIMAKYDSAGTLREWRFWVGATGLLTFELYDESADTTEIASSTAALTAGQWQFVVATYDGTAATPELYLYVDAAAVNDGSTVETGAYVGLEDTAAPLTIGCSGVTAVPVNEFHGRIALPFITGKKLTAANVLQLHAIMAPMVGIC
jgi:hypothetical protein